MLKSNIKFHPLYGVINVINITKTENKKNLAELSAWEQECAPPPQVFHFFFISYLYDIFLI